MEDLAVVLPGLFCAGGMALMMWLMTRNPSGPSRPDRNGRGWPRSTDDQISLLRDEIARLRAERAPHPQDQPADRVD